MNERMCEVGGCDSIYYAKGTCRKHYQRARFSPKGRTIEERFWAKVAKSDACWNWTGHITPGPLGGYGRIWANGRHIVSHRFSYELAVGSIPEGMEIDHTCHNRACVNPDHLRAVTRKQNVENVAGVQANNKSGVTGVSWARNERKWRAEVRHAKKAYYLGYYTDLQEAERVVVAKRNELFTHNDIDRTQAA